MLKWRGRSLYEEISNPGACYLSPGTPEPGTGINHCTVSGKVYFLPLFCSFSHAINGSK